MIVEGIDVRVVLVYQNFGILELVVEDELVQYWVAWIRVFEADRLVVGVHHDFPGILELVDKVVELKHLIVLEILGQLFFAELHVFLHVVRVCIFGDVFLDDLIVALHYEDVDGIHAVEVALGEIDVVMQLSVLVEDLLEGLALAQKIGSQSNDSILCRKLEQLFDIRIGAFTVLSLFRVLFLQVIDNEERHFFVVLSQGQIEGELFKAVRVRKQAQVSFLQNQVHLIYPARLSRLLQNVETVYVLQLQHRELRLLYLF